MTNPTKEYQFWVSGPVRDIAVHVTADSVDAARETAARLGKEALDDLNDRDHADLFVELDKIRVDETGGRE